MSKTSKYSSQSGRKKLVFLNNTASNHLITIKLQEGLNLQNTGDLVRAQSIYEEILALNPKNFNALQLLGAIAAQSKEWERSLELLDKAITIKSTNAIVYNNRGIVLHELNLLDEAVDSYEKAIKLDSKYAEAYYNRGITLHKLNKLDAAVKSYDAAIILNSEYVEAYYNRGVLLHLLNKFDEAINSYKRAIELRPTYAEAFYNQGVSYQEIGCLDEALYSYDQAISIRQDYSEAYYNSGILLNELNKLNDAILKFDMAIFARPNYSEAFNNRGLVQKKLNRHEDSIFSYTQAFLINPRYTEAYYNCGNALQELGLLDESINSYNKAIALEPHYADAYWNKSISLLLKGDFEEGFELYEWRWKRSGAKQQIRDISIPVWTGNEPLVGKTILLHAEQGLGDSIQFFRYIKLVLDTGAIVFLEVPNSLISLFEEVKGNCIIVNDGLSLNNLDFHCPLLSLPRAFRTKLTSIPSPEPYIKSNLEKVKAWKQKLGNKIKPRIGLVWRGSPTHSNDHNRSITFEELENYLSTDYEFISIHKALPDNDKKHIIDSHVRHFGSKLHDFSQTAALIELMDIVISVDTSVAHLSAALGKRTWILLPFIPDWRWMLEREDSPWYRSVKLFRQGKDRNWQPVLERISFELKNLFNEFQSV